MRRCLDPIEFMRAIACGYAAPLVPDCGDESPVAALSADETLTAIYELAASLRLAIIYCTSLGGPLRKHWATRLGGVNLASPAAAGEIEVLRRELASCETDWNDELHREAAQIRHGLWRLRELCRQHQALLTSSAKRHALRYVGWAKARSDSFSAWASRHSGEGKSRARRPSLSPLRSLAHRQEFERAILPTLRNPPHASQRLRRL